MTAEYDISFGVVRREAGGAEKEVVPPARVDCHMVPEDGSVLCPEPATCRFNVLSYYI